MQDPYEALELSEDASDEEVDAAYRRLARQWHPDRHVGASAEEQATAAVRMAEVTGAYQLLQDPMAMARYRAARRRVQARVGETGARPATGRGAASPAERPARPSASAGPTSPPFDYRRAAPSEFGRAAPGPAYGYTARSDGPRRRVHPTPPTRAPRLDRWRYGATIAAILLVVPVVVVGILDAVTGRRAQPEASAVVQPGTPGAGHDAAVVGVGACFDAVTSERQDGSGRVHSVALRPCDQPHESEAIGILDLRELGPAYPGRQAIAAHVSPQCERAFAAVLGVPFTAGVPMDLHWLHPSPESWVRGDRRVVCAVSSSETPHMRGPARALVAR